MVVAKPWWCLGLMIVAGCLSANAQVCDDGTICPEGRTCAVVHGLPLCVTPDQLSDCRDRQEAEACGTDRRCYAGVCVPSSCGDGIVDPGELCDDGNQVAGDGCAATCDSYETCGNGIIDLVRGERCDDGPEGRWVSHDGCASDCSTESAGWVRIPKVRDLFFADRPAAAYDARRGRLVMIGEGATWEWDGKRWELQTPPVSPGRRPDAALAYDAGRGRVVLFGGGPFRDTWEWDGTTWELRDPATSPPARRGHVMAYDPRRHRVVMFGGSTGIDGMDLGDTWTYDGDTWTELTGSQPPPRSGATLVYDPRRDKLVLFGGLSGTTTAETWELDASGWTQVTTVMAPPARHQHVSVFDPVTGRVLVQGGRAGVVGSLSETWAWDGTTWTKVAPDGDRPAVRHVIAGMTREGTLALVTFEGTYRWTGTGWAVSTVFEPAPVNRFSAAVATDVVSGHTVLHGGIATSFLAAQTFVWNGQWTSVTGPTPGPLAGAAMAFDARRGQFVLFGGYNASGVGDTKTWIFDGATWTVATPSVSPSRRTAPVMVYDAARERVVLFGGTGVAGELDDTWLWDGVTWTQALPATSPDPRTSAAATYDPLREEVVLFGGDSGQLIRSLGDTWAWDGVTWHLRTSSGPAPRFSSAMAWDPARRRAVIFGGADDSITFEDQWEWTGTAWTQLPVVVAAQGRSLHAMVTSPTGDGVLSISGYNDFAAVDDVLWLRWGGGSPDETCAGDDPDHDGRTGCVAATFDPDCWLVCRPACSPGAEASLACTQDPAGCGDGTCATSREDCATCPQDCGACPTICGDFACAMGEAATCPGDCP